MPKTTLKALRERLEQIHAEATSLALNAATDAEKKAANLAEEACQHALGLTENGD